MTHHPTPPLRRIRQRLSAARRRLAAGEILAGILWCLAAVAALWTLATGVEAGFWLAPTVRTVVVLILASIVTVMAARFILWPLLRWAGLVRAVTDDAVASRIGRAMPDVSDRLLNLLQLVDGRHSDAPRSLVHAAAVSLSDTLQHVRLEQVEDFAAVRRAGRLSLLPLSLLAAFLILAPETFLGASGRLMSPASDFSRPAPFAVGVTPGDIELVRGAELRVRAVLSGTRLPVELEMEYRFDDESVIERVEAPVRDRVAEFTIVNLRRSLGYRVGMGDTWSRWHAVHVIDRPVIGQLQLVLRYPAYTRLPDMPLAPNEGNVSALTGTEVLLEAVVTGPELRDARLAFGNAEDVDLRVEGRQVRGGFRVRRDDTWSVEAESVDGVTTADPVVYSVRRLLDAVPTVSVLSPESEFDLDESATVPLAWTLADDFGFTDLRLHVRLEASRFDEPWEDFATIQLPLDPSRPVDQAGSLAWDLPSTTGIDPVPGDVIVYYLEVTDNDRVTGPKSARTEIHRLRMPSLAERYESLEADEDRTEEELLDILDRTDELREDFEELQDQLRREPDADWQDERAAEQLQQRQQAIEETVRDVTERIESLTEDMERNDLVGEETLELFRDLQEVAREIDSPELMEALQELHEAMQEMDLPRMQDAMERFRFDEEQYRERLERTLELFRNLRVQRELDEAARRAQELAERQEEIAEQTAEHERRQDEEAGDQQETPDVPEESEENAGEEPDDRATDQTEPIDSREPASPEQLAREQERAAEDMEALEEMLQQLQERMQNARQAPSRSMEDLSRQTESQQLPERMRQNAQQLQDQQFGPARQSQQDMSQMLQDLQMQLQQMQQGMAGAQMNVNLAGLRRALDNVLALSSDQEVLRADVMTLTTDSPELRESARRQARLGDGLATVSDTLQSLARQIPQMGRDVQAHAGEAGREMTNATSAMTDRIAPRAVGHQKGAMTHLNELALLLTDLMEQMMGSGGGSGSMSMQQMIEQLQQMAGQQQQLNQQLQQLLNDMAGNRLSSDAAERLRQLGAQQQQIRDQLRELGRNREIQSRALGDLDRIAEQMQETIEELTLRQLTPRTVMRQRQILTRLLEATRSLQERGRDRRRESRTGEDHLRESPDAVSPRERADQLRRDLIRALESGYAPDFEDLIRQYFDLLRQDASEPGTTPPDSASGDRPGG